jgi:hypothetical protein
MQKTKEKKNKDSNYKSKRLASDARKVNRNRASERKLKPNKAAQKDSISNAIQRVHFPVAIDCRPKIKSYAITEKEMSRDEILTLAGQIYERLRLHPDFKDNDWKATTTQEEILSWLFSELRSLVNVPVLVNIGDDLAYEVALYYEMEDSESTHFLEMVQYDQLRKYDKKLAQIFFHFAKCLVKEFRVSSAYDYYFTRNYDFLECEVLCNEEHGEEVDEIFKERIKEYQFGGTINKFFNRLFRGRFDRIKLLTLISSYQCTDPNLGSILVDLHKFISEYTSDNLDKYSHPELYDNVFGSTIPLHLRISVQWDLEDSVSEYNMECMNTDAGEFGFEVAHIKKDFLKVDDPFYCEQSGIVRKLQKIVTRVNQGFYEYINKLAKTNDNNKTCKSI